MQQKVFDRDRTKESMIPYRISNLMEEFIHGNAVEREERKQIMEIIWLVYGSDGLRGVGYDFVVSQPLFKRYEADMKTFMDKLTGAYKQ